MGARFWAVRRLVVVLFGLLLTGCAEMVQRRMGRLDEGPPVPAPTLHIPDPPKQGTAAVAQLDPPPPQTDAPIVQAKAETAANPVRSLYEKAAAHYRTMGSYTMRFRRREVVAGKARPEELILVKFREQPWSVYFKWIGPEAKGREVIYVKGRPGNEIHTLTAAGDVLLLPAGQRFSINADSPLVKSKSRYPITAAGLGVTISKFGAIIEGVEKGDPKQGKLKYLGRVKRPEFEEAVEGIEQLVPPQSDPLLPTGGRRWWFFDSVLSMPVLVITHDDAGHEVEFYCHDRIQAPARLDDDDFNPDKLWRSHGDTKK